MLAFNQAQQQLLDSVEPLSGTESLPLLSCLNRVLAEDIVATLNLPPADNSAMDGYALRYEDFAQDQALSIQQKVFAGSLPQGQEAGKISRVFTGSLIPAGADTVVMQENCVEQDGKVTIVNMPKKGQHIRLKGEDTTVGRLLLTKGTLIGAAEIGLLATQGFANISVMRALKIGILTTGDELIQPGESRNDSQIYNSNGPMITALALNMQAHVVHTLHAKDNEVDLLHTLNTLFADCDLVLSIGGVSVGEKDLIKGVLAAMGANLNLWKVKMKPGKPVAMAQINHKTIICLPGNPVSAFTVFALLVSPLIRKMQGRKLITPAIEQATLNCKQSFKETRDEFLRVQKNITPAGALLVAPYEKQGSGIVSSLSWATGFARIAADQEFNNGDTVPYYDLAKWIS